MTNIPQEMTHFREEGRPNTLGFFLSLVTFGTPRAVVNVLPSLLQNVLGTYSHHHVIHMCFQACVHTQGHGSWNTRLVLGGGVSMGT